MQTFRKWLEAQETMVRQDIAGKHMSDRVSFGKKVESNIISKLTDAGWKITPASQSQDMFDKIDGFVHLSNTVLPIQIKYRDSQDDILLEVMKGWTPEKFGVGVPIEFNGRDMIGHAAIYVSLSKDGNTIRVRSANEAKSVAESMVRRLKDNYRKSGGKETSLQTPKGEAKITNDPANPSLRKVMAFIKPGALTKKLPPELMTFGMDIPLRTSFWAAA
jgi:hypothetical protein